MEAVKMTLSEKIAKELEQDFEKSMQDKEFATLVKRLKINKKLAMNNNS